VSAPVRRPITEPTTSASPGGTVAVLADRLKARRLAAQRAVDNAAATVERLAQALHGFAAELEGATRVEPSEQLRLLSHGLASNAASLALASADVQRASETLAMLAFLLDPVKL